MSEEPPPQTERACQRADLRDLLSELEKNAFPSWKLLFHLVCSSALQLMIRSILSPRPAANFPIVRARRHRDFTTTLGLIDLVRSSSSSLAAPLLLSSSPSVGRRRAEPLSTLEGQVLVEVLAAYSDFPFRGTITIGGDRQIGDIYSRPDWDHESVADFYWRKIEWLARHAAFDSDSSSEFKTELLLTGPGCAISAFFGFSICAYLPEMDGCYTEGYVRPPHWDDDLSMHEGDLTTITITTHMGSLYVTCAVLRDAVRAGLDLMVRVPYVYDFAEVHGHVVAYIGTLEIGTTLFSRDILEPEDVPFTHSQQGIGKEFCLPLDRYPLAVPLESWLHIKGEIVLNRTETISINHSIPTESHSFETGWVKENDFHTAVCLHLSYVWA